MFINLKNLLFLAVFYFQPPTYLFDFLHSSAKGSLQDPWRLNFSFGATEFNGVILYCIDSGMNQFMMKVTEGIATDKIMDLKYNNMKKVINLKELCGFDQLEDKMINFNLKLLKITIYISCNSHNSTSFSIADNREKLKSKNNIKPLYPIPLSMVNDRKSVYIMIGNIGPYVGEDNVTVTPLREQLTACLNTFYYNDSQITFIKEGTKVLSTCPQKCSNNICNGGKCTERTYPYNKIICDCSFTALNGPYCNKDLIIYNKEGNNSYKNLEKIKKIYIKMTWRQILYRIYCLLEIIGKHDTFVIWTNKSHLMVNNITISDINIDGINFINVNVTDNYLVLKYKNIESKINFFFVENMRINVGFSWRNEICQAFEGAYDFLYNTSEIKEDKDCNDLTTGICETKTSTYTIVPENQTKFKNILIIGSLACGGSLLFILFIFTLYLKSQRDMKVKIERIAAMRSLHPDQSRVIYTESGVYGVVEDRSNYDYIIEPEENTTNAT